MSSIHYKFRSVKDYDTYTFEGAGIPVWELKQEIINSKRLSKATDFDLILSNAQTNQEYTDDATIIPKNSSIIVRRVPAAPGRRFFQPRTLYAPLSRPAGAPRPSGAPVGDEESKIAAMMNESSSHWSQNQQMPSQSQYSAVRKMYRPKNPVVPPPPNYVCFRCGQKGHYILNCPTNTDANFDRPRIRKTTGIPKTFLKPLERTDADVTPVLSSSANILLSAEGNLVVMEPNESVWSKVVGTQRFVSLSGDSAPEHFKCLICTRILTDPVYFSCCPSVSYCDECIRGALLKNDNMHRASTCRSCHNPVSIESLRSNEPLAHEIASHFGKYPVS